MSERLEEYWKYSVAVILCLLVMSVSAQKGDTTGVGIKEIKHWDFDLGLLPAQHIYGMSWDEQNIDLPAYNYELMKSGYLLELSEEGCDYVHPFQGHITSKYGWRRSRWHKGIDIKLNIGDPVYAAFDGVVRIQRYNPGGFGNYVLIRHYNGLETIYGHLSEALVVRNQTVRAGQVIAFGGSTGRSTGPHLHFETRLMGQAFNPARIIDFESFQLKDTQVLVNHMWFPYVRKGNTRANVVPANAKRYHKIRRGDTLSGISRRYGSSVNTICRLNRISRTTTLRIGRTLRVK
jgi:murein DD-endopeptidase MepM/ murein hydrolase activator NlpD